MRAVSKKRKKKDIIQCQISHFKKLYNMISLTKTSISVIKEIKARHSFKIHKRKYKNMLCFQEGSSLQEGINLIEEYMWAGVYIIAQLLLAARGSPCFK